MNALIDWAAMAGYGGYVWGVLLLCVLAVGYEIGRLRAAEKRLRQALGQQPNDTAAQTRGHHEA